MVCEMRDRISWPCMLDWIFECLIELNVRRGQWMMVDGSCI